MTIDARTIWPISDKCQEILVKRDGRKVITTPVLATIDGQLNAGCARDFANSNGISCTSVPHVDKTIDGVQVLLSSMHIRAAINLTTEILLSYGFAHTSKANVMMTKEILDLWSLRLHMLIAIEQTQYAAVEVDSFGDLDAPDLRFEYYEENKIGSFVPFSMRLMHAELPCLAQQRHSEAIMRCNKLIFAIEKILATHANDKQVTQLWQKRLCATRQCLARVFLANQDYDLCIHTLVASIKDSDTDATTAAETYSSIGRVCLQLGHIANAAKWFAKFNSCCDQNDKRMAALACMHKGLLSVATGNAGSDALRHFTSAQQYNPQMYTSVNNISVCQLYAADVNGAIDSLQKTIVDKQHMNEAMITNICTLYELCCTQHASTNKLAILNASVAQYGDVLPIQCFKLQQQ